MVKFQFHGHHLLITQNMGLLNQACDFIGVQTNDCLVGGIMSLIILIVSVVVGLICCLFLYGFGFLRGYSNGLDAATQLLKERLENGNVFNDI